MADDENVVALTNSIASGNYLLFMLTSAEF
jgi:hypothetical protein